MELTRTDATHVLVFIKIDVIMRYFLKTGFTNKGHRFLAYLHSGLNVQLVETCQHCEHYAAIWQTNVNAKCAFIS